MNPYSNPFTGYKEIPQGVQRKSTVSDNSLSSPHSDSTTQYAHSVSPNIHEVGPAAHEIPFEAWNYADNYGLQEDGSYGTDPLSVKIEAEDKLSAKSKRIMKRNVAKERTKTRKESEAFLVGVDPKFLPEGFDDPNLDEKTRKKMVQMVRNRISAQNSRDRKKVFMQQIEDVNTRLMDQVTTLEAEKTTLMNEITRLQQSEAQLILENQTLRDNIENNNNNNLCSHCKRGLNQDDPLFIDEYNNNNQQLEEDNTLENFGTLSSPILSRFSSNGRGLFTFFTFAALVCVILVMNVNPTGEVALQGGKKVVMDTRLLEVKNEYCIEPNSYIGNPQEIPHKNSLVIRNMQPLRNHFDLNYAPTFKSHVQKLALADISSAGTCPTTDEHVETANTNSLMKYEEQPKIQNAIVDYDYFRAANLRKKSPTIIARNLPQLSQSSGESIKTSTLFCPSGFEFMEPKSENMENVEIEPRDRILDLEKADYLQLFVPRQGLVRYSLHNNASTLYDLPIVSEDAENSMLEIWCKVFLIRDLSSNL